MRIRRNLNQAKANILCNRYVFSPFTYCPIIWMFCGKKANNMINNVYKRGLRCVLNDLSMPLDDLLIKTERVLPHQQNLRILMLEIYKSLNCLNPEFMRDIFTIKYSPYPLRVGTTLNVPNAVSSHGVNSFIFRGALAWNKLPKHIKESPSIQSFKNNLRNINLYCKCSICL